MRSQSDFPYYSFLLFYEDSKYPVAFIHFTKGDNNYWLSPAGAPFGGFVINEDCPLNGIQFLFQTLENWLKIKLCTVIKIKAPSMIYECTQNFSSYLYTLLGFKIHEKNTNFHISTSLNPFTSIIKPQEKRRLQKCIRSGFIVKPINNSNISEIYEFIVINRELQKYNLSITLEKLSQQIAYFQNNFKMMGVFDGDQMIAVSLCVVVTNKVLYNFLVSDCPTYRSFSPVVMLYEALYNYCQIHYYQALDLGISIDNDGNYKSSLARFKLNMGAQITEKITWSKEI